MSIGKILITKYIDVDWWIDSKLNNKPLSEVIEKKYLRLSRLRLSENERKKMNGLQNTSERVESLKFTVRRNVDSFIRRDLDNKEEK